MQQWLVNISITLRGFGCYSETVPIAQARVIDKTMEKQQDC